MNKSRMNKLEKVFYKTVLAKIENGDCVNFKTRMYWLGLHLNKTY
jgi:hypothetical protein